MLLPPPHNPFTIKMPYKVRSDLYKMGKPLYGYPEDTFFMVDTDYEATITECLGMLTHYPDHARVYLTDDVDNLTVCLWEVATTIAEDQPDHAACDGTRFTSKLLGLSLVRGGGVDFDAGAAHFPELGAACYAHLQGLAPFDQLCDMLRFSVQEDLVISKVGTDGTDYMECLLVPLPSKWNPQVKIGLNLANVHAPIPNSEGLVAASSRLVDAIMTKGPYVRYNWTLSSDKYAQNPAIESVYKAVLDPGEMMQQVHFRVERQTFKAFPQLGRYLFTIHTYLHPMAQVLTTHERQQDMLDVLLSMPPAIREHRQMVNGMIETLRTRIS